MATRKRPPITPPQPSANQGISGIQQSPYAITGAQVATATSRTGGVFGEYDSAKAELDSITELLARADAARAEFGAGGIGQAPKETVVFNEKVLNLQQFDKEVAALKKNLAQAKKRFAAAEKVVKPLEKKVEYIKDQINGAGDDQARRAKWEKQLPDAEAKLAKAKELPVGTKMTKTVTGKAATTTTTKPVAKEVTSAADFRRFEEMGTTAPTPATTPQPTPAPTGGATGGTGGGTGGTAGTGGGRGPKGAPEKPAVGQRYTGPKGATFEWDGKKWNRITEQEWAKIVQEEFGPLWDVYNSNSDVKDVLDRSVQEGWFDDETKLSESLRGTGWYRTTERAARQFAIRQSTDPAQVEDEILAKIEDVRGSASANALSFDESTLRKLATDTIKYGWSEQQQLNALGSEAVAQARAGGARGVADLRSGFVGQDLRKTAAAYAQKPQDELLDSWITDIMTGKKTQEQWKDLMRSTAATQFRSLQPALDKGQDVTTAMFAYKQQASRILGEVMDTTDIDWTDSKWNPALNYRDPKTNEYRQMDLWEWNKYLRGMSEWQQTTEAKNVYGNVAMSLQNAFSTKGTGGATQ